MSAAPNAPAATLMDAMYRHQRHIYDASRKFYLLGRDEMIAGLEPPPGGTILEIGCGTGRNLIRIAQLYPGRACHGLDVSAEMLATARQAVARAGLEGRIRLAQADATSFDPGALFGRAQFDRIAISYALSMIPPWREVIGQALQRLAPGGSLHIVDFGDQAGLPGPFKTALRRWLALFHVTPRIELPLAIDDLLHAPTGRFRGTVEPLFRGYAMRAVVERLEG